MCRCEQKSCRRAQGRSRRAVIRSDDHGTRGEFRYRGNERAGAAVLRDRAVASGVEIRG
jgi:hypothetical protein